MRGIAAEELELPPSRRPASRKRRTLHEELEEAESGGSELPPTVPERPEEDPEEFNEANEAFAETEPEGEAHESESEPEAAPNPSFHTPGGLSSRWQTYNAIQYTKVFLT